MVFGKDKDSWSYLIYSFAAMILLFLSVFLAALPFPPIAKISIYLIWLYGLPILLILNIVSAIYQIKNKKKIWFAITSLVLAIIILSATFTYWFSAFFSWLGLA